MSAKIPEFQDTNICAKCGGKCCKHMACHLAPSDFEEVTFDSLKTEIERGFISIDWWESDKHQYYLRVRHKGAPIVDPSWGGECMLLTENGCRLPFERRPLGARSLEPRDDGKCVVHYSKEMCKNEWLEYDDILTKLANYFSNKEESQC